MSDNATPSTNEDQAQLSSAESAGSGAELFRQLREDEAARKSAAWVVGLQVVALVVTGLAMCKCFDYYAYQFKLKFDALGIAYPARFLFEVTIVSVIVNYWYLLFVATIPALLFIYRIALSIGRTLGPRWAKRYGIALACLIFSRAVYTWVVFQSS